MSKDEDIATFLVAIYDLNLYRIEIDNGNEKTVYNSLTFEECLPNVLKKYISNYIDSNKNELSDLKLSVEKVLLTTPKETIDILLRKKNF